MIELLRNIYLQPIAVLTTSGQNGMPAPEALQTDPAGNSIERLDSSIPGQVAEIPSSQVLRTTFQAFRFFGNRNLVRNIGSLERRSVS